jgi:sugar phosphate permease
MQPNLNLGRKIIMTNVIPNIGLASRRAPLSRMFRGATGMVFILLCLMYFIEYVDRVNLSVAGPLIRKEMHLSNIQLGIAFSAFGYCYAATQLLGGYLGDRIGSRLSLTILGLIWACGTFATGLAGGWLFWLPHVFWLGLVRPARCLPPRA